jgi:N utilization substance protein B
VGKRRKAREIVLQACYAWQIAGTPLEDCLADQIARRQPAVPTQNFARQLAQKIILHQAETERWLANLLEHWEPERVGMVERVILLQALTELRHSPDIPWRVVINEACELARRFGDENAVVFVNGLLDRAATEAGCRTADPESGPETNATEGRQPRPQEGSV